MAASEGVLQTKDIAATIVVWLTSLKETKRPVWLESGRVVGGFSQRDTGGRSQRASPAPARIPALLCGKEGAIGRL